MRGHHPTVVAISTATAFSLLGDQMLYAVLPVYFADLGLTGIEVGIILSANRWIRLATNHFAHVVSPRTTPRRWLIVAFVLGTLTTLGYAATSSFTVLVMARLLWGLAWSFIRHIGVLEVVAHAPVDAPARAMGFYQGVSRVGSVAGLLGGAALVDAFGYVAAVWLLTITSLASVVLIVRDRTLSTTPARTHAHVRQAPIDRQRIVELVLGFSLGIVGPGFVTATLGVVLQPYSADMHVPGLTAATMTGALLGIRFVIESIAAPSLGSLSDRWGVRRTASTFFLLGGVALLVASARPEAVFLLTLALLAFYFSSTALNAGIAATVSQHGSAAYARYVTASDVGAAAGPLLGWIAVDLFGYAAVGLVLGGAFYLTAALLARVYLK
jgi:predicted MFS family arabinose efflux permease